MAVILEMETEKFISLADNPRQRDTKSHAAKAMRKHLKKESPTHTLVAVATIMGVPVCKLDGHTRAYLWERDFLKKPDKVLAAAYEVTDIAGAAELYSNFDNCDAAENAKDRMSGAVRECGLVLSSGLLHNCDFATALKFAEKPRGFAGLSEYILVNKWREPIVNVDNLGLSKNKFKGSGLVALMFVLFASKYYRPETVSDFFIRFNNDEGKKEGKRRDGVQALTEHMLYRRLNNQMTGAENIIDQMCRGLSCLRAWTESEMIVNVQSSEALLQKIHSQALANLSQGE